MNSLQFLYKHGIYPKDTYEAYHMSLGLYLLYMVEGMRQAEAIEDGLVFDEAEASVILENLSISIEVIKDYRKNLNYEFTAFDLAETVTMEGCQLKQGKVVGSRSAAIKIARMWIDNYLNGSGNTFTYEVGVYILFLLDEEVSYDFLINRNGEMAGTGTKN